MIKINVEKAKEIHKNKMREAREPLLKEKDVEYMRSLESGDQKKIQEIVDQKQKLRDVTLQIDKLKITSTDIMKVTKQLKQVWDEDLLGPNPYFN